MARVAGVVVVFEAPQGRDPEAEAGPLGNSRIRMGEARTAWEEASCPEGMSRSSWASGHRRT